MCRRSTSKTLFLELQMTIKGWGTLDERYDGITAGNDADRSWRRVFGRHLQSIDGN